MPHIHLLPKKLTHSMCRVSLVVKLCKGVWGRDSSEPSEPPLGPPLVSIVLKSGISGCSPSADDISNFASFKEKN